MENQFKEFKLIMGPKPPQSTLTTHTNLIREKKKTSIKNGKLFNSKEVERKSKIHQYLE